MTSGIYRGTVVHHRLAPVLHRFVYPYLAFFLDLDELPALSRKLRFFGLNRFNLFSFHDRDHISERGGSAREKLAQYLRLQGIEVQGVKIYLLTQLRILGYVFNPVSFYFCFDSSGRPLCAVPEVGNTFGEMKFYFLGPASLDSHGSRFIERKTKHFYVSPFAGLEDIFEFNLEIPGSRLQIRIDDYLPAGDSPVLRTALQGTRVALTDLALLTAALRFPLITLRVIATIHWQALKLYLKKTPFHAKAANPHLQTEVHNARH